VTNGDSKTLPEALAELRDELKEFAATRLAMLRAELNEKLRSFKMAAPVMGAGLVLLGTAWLLLTACLVCAIAYAFPYQGWNLVISFAIVGALYLAIGGLATVLAWRQIREKGVTPERTIRVLKEDAVWLQTEAKTQL